MGHKNNCNFILNKIKRGSNFEISYVWNVDRIFILNPILTCYFSLNWLCRELWWSVDWFPPSHTVSAINLTETCGKVQIYKIWMLIFHPTMMQFFLLIAFHYRLLIGGYTSHWSGGIQNFLYHFKKGLQFKNFTYKESIYM